MANIRALTEEEGGEFESDDDVFISTHDAEETTHEQWKYALLQTIALVGQTLFCFYTAKTESNEEAEFNPYIFLAYLKNISLLITFLYELTASGQTISALCKNQNLDKLNEPSTLRDLAITTSLTVDLFSEIDGSGTSLESALLHGASTFALILKVALNKQSYAEKLCSPAFVIPIVFGTVFFVMNAVLTLTGQLSNEIGEPLYSSLDWNKHPGFATGRALIEDATFAFFPLLKHLFFYYCMPDKQADNLITISPLSSPGATRLSDNACCFWNRPKYKIVTHRPDPSDYQVNTRGF